MSSNAWLQCSSLSILSYKKVLEKKNMFQFLTSGLNELFFGIEQKLSRLFVQRSRNREKLLQHPHSIFFYTRKYMG